MVCTDCHTFDPLFNPPYISPKPMFLPKIMAHKVLFFSHCPEFWKCSTQRPLISWNLRKRYPNAPIFMAFVTKRPPIFCLAYTCLFQGNVAPSNTVRARKFCILETESCNLVNTFRCKFNKGAENKISVLQAQPTQLCIMDELHWRAGMIQAISPSQTRKGIYPTTTLYKSAHLAL